MGLPKEASSHHTVWVQPWYGGRPRALRYATSGSHLYCFGDDGLAGVADGEQVTASIHRISFGGQDDPDFLKIGSLLVVTAPLPLAVGISLDTYVAAGRALQSDTAALLLAAAALITPLIFWYALPAWRRLAS